MTRFFQRDSSKAGNLTLYPHKEREFWLWVSSWAVFITKPSDLGYSDEGYDLPELKVVYHRVTIPGSELSVKDNQVVAFDNKVVDLKGSAREKRESLLYRLQKAVEVIGDSDEHWLMWHHLEDERKALQKAFDCEAVYGSQHEAVKEQLLIDFAEGKYAKLATKPVIAGSGCNFQKHCHLNLFLGINYKFNEFIQAIHRTLRYQQSNQVEVHIIYTANEEPIIKELLAKWTRHNEQVAIMVEIIKKYGLSTNGIEEMKRTIGLERRVQQGREYTAVNNDCVQETKLMDSDSVGLIHTSIPFGNHYEYSPSYNDFGHTDDDAHFFAQMDFLTPELLRILQPGRLAVVHVKDRIEFGNVTGMGMPTVNPFHCETIAHYRKHGFAYMGMITIETDVVRENNQTYRLGWSEQCKDGSKMGVGSPEYLLLFRKLPSDNCNAYADLPVNKTKEEYTRGQWQIDARAKWNSSGNRLITPEEVAALSMTDLSRLYGSRAEQFVYDYKTHVDVAIEMDQKGKLPATFETLKVPARYGNVWSDVNRMRTLNTNQSQKREQNHICPLQFDIVERVIRRYSNEGDLVLDPFGGLMTVPMMAVKMARKGYGIELNPQYFESGWRYCREEELKKSVPTLFDTLPQESKTA